MFDNLGTNVQPITDLEVNDIFQVEGLEKPKDKTKDKTAKDKTETDKTKDKPSEKSSDKTKSKKDKPASSLVNTDKAKAISDLTEKDEDELFNSDDENDEDDEDDDEDKNKNKKKVVKKKDTEEEEEEEDETDDNDEGNDEDDNNEEEEEPADEETQIKDFLKARVNLLIKKGEWADYDGREEEEWTEERFEEVELDQRNYQKKLMTDEILDSFGPIGREIATYTANGGDPDELIDIFKEQQRVESFQIDSEDAQKQIVLKYQTEFLNQKPERAKKYIDTLIADKELLDVAKEAKEAMEESLAQQALDLQTQQQEIVKAAQSKQKAQIQEFSANVTKIVNADANIPADEKQLLIKVLTKYDRKLPNGTPVNEFYQKFAEFRKDIPNYIKLVRLVMNPDKFEKGLKTAGKNDANEKSFKLIRGANKSRKIKSKDTSNQGGSNKSGTKFRLL